MGHTSLKFLAHAAAVEQLAHEGLREHVDEVFEQTQAEVPVRSGALKASGRVVDEGGSISILYGGPEAPYAVAVHYDSEPGGQRFITDPVYSRAGALNRQVSQYVARNLRRKLPRLE